MATLTGGGIFTFLTAQAGLVALIAQRVYPRRLPQDPVFPLVVYRRISTPRPLAHTGYSGLASPRIQFDVWASDPDSADAVAEQLRLALHGYRGAMGDVVVGSSEVVNDIDDDDPVPGLYRRVLDVVITHSEVAV